MAAQKRRLPKQSEIRFTDAETKKILSLVARCVVAVAKVARLEAMPSSQNPRSKTFRAWSDASSAASDVEFDLEEFIAELSYRRYPVD